MGCWGGEMGGFGVVEFGMFYGLFEVMDFGAASAAWRWNMVKNIYLFLLKHILSPSFPSLSLWSQQLKHLPEKKKNPTPSSSFPS